MFKLSPVNPLSQRHLKSSPDMVSSHKPCIQRLLCFAHGDPKM